LRKISIGRRFEFSRQPDRGKSTIRTRKHSSYLASSLETLPAPEASIRMEIPGAGRVAFLRWRGGRLRLEASFRSHDATPLVFRQSFPPLSCSKIPYPAGLPLWSLRQHRSLGEIRV
jgi:hypothetical protein